MSGGDGGRCPPGAAPQGRGPQHAAAPPDGRPGGRDLPPSHRPPDRGTRAGYLAPARQRAPRPRGRHPPPAVRGWRLRSGPHDGNDRAHRRVRAAARRAEPRAAARRARERGRAPQVAPAPATGAGEAPRARRPAPLRPRAGVQRPPPPPGGRAERPRHACADRDPAGPGHPAHRRSPAPPAWGAPVPARDRAAGAARVGRPALRVGGEGRLPRGARRRQAGMAAPPLGVPPAGGTFTRPPLSPAFSRRCPGPARASPGRRTPGSPGCAASARGARGPGTGPGRPAARAPRPPSASSR